MNGAQVKLLLKPLIEKAAKQIILTQFGIDINTGELMNKLKDHSDSIKDPEAKENYKETLQSQEAMVKAKAQAAIGEGIEKVKGLKEDAKKKIQDTINNAKAQVTQQLDNIKREFSDLTIDLGTLADQTVDLGTRIGTEIAAISAAASKPLIGVTSDGKVTTTEGPIGTGAATITSLLSSIKNQGQSMVQTYEKCENVIQKYSLYAAMCPGVGSIIKESNNILETVGKIITLTGATL